MNSPRKYDDPFLSDGDEPGKTMTEREWSKVDYGMKNSGLRDGLESNHDSILQDGFNSAFKEALQMSISAGKLQGAISALLSLPVQSGRQVDTTGQQTESKLQQLLTSNSNLMAQIPDLMDPSLVSCSASTTTASSCCTEDQHTPEQDETLVSPSNGQVKKSIGSCGDVCTDQKQFWNQLESLRNQGQELGVLSST